jgi:hypothetical protein
MAVPDIDRVVKVAAAAAAIRRFQRWFMQGILLLAATAI